MMPDDSILPANLVSLHAGEEFLREKALDLISSNARLQLHLSVVEAAMELADVLRQSGAGRSGIAGGGQHAPGRRPGGASRGRSPRGLYGEPGFAAPHRP